MNYKQSAIRHKLIIGWLYPDLMSTYGDRGNIIVLQKRCEWRGIDVQILPINQSTNAKELKSIDLLFGGGAQDREQEMVMRDLKNEKGRIIKEMIEDDLPALFVCGSPQLMGKYYEPAEGERIEGLGIFDMESKHPGKNAKRLIGNVIAEVNWQNLSRRVIPDLIGDPDSRLRGNDKLVVGFENHGGRTYLGKSGKPFAKVIKGFGNNGKDGTEGVVYKNAVGCYLHGPLLPKNPQIADYFIELALFEKYQEKVDLKVLDDTLEKQAQLRIAQKLGVRL